MRLSEFGVRYPVTATMIFAAMIILGLISLFRLGLDLMPEIEIPVISVLTAYEGAGPEEVESKITKVLEDGLATVNNLDQIYSTSEEGISAISLKFDWGTNLDEAANDVRDIVDLSARMLPEDIDRPTIFKFDLSMMPILVLAVTADESYPILYDLIDDRICDPLKTIPGVAAAYPLGGLERQVLVGLDRSRLEAYHLSVSTVTEALRRENLDIPAGHIKTGLKDYLIRTPEEVKIEEVEKIPVSTTKDGVVVHIKDIATVKDTFKENTQEVEVNGRKGLMVVIQKQSGANTVEVTEKVLRKLEGLKKDLPPDVKIVVARDFSDFIKSAMGNLKGALYLGFIFVILVILFFLRNLRAGFIIACSIPTSLIVALFLLYLGGYTLNIISVSSLAIAMGMVVDASIVVLDNIFRHREKGEKPREAAIFGASEVGKAISASTLTTIVIFVPLVFVGGITAIMFSEMAYVICLTLLASLLTALVLVPMLSSKFLLLKKEQDVKIEFLRKLYLRSEVMLRRLDTAYKEMLDWSLSHRKTVILAGASLLFISLLLLPLVGTRFMPEVDSNMFRLSVELPVGTRLEETGKVIKDLEGLIEKEVPERTVMFARWGYSTSARMRMVFGGEGTNLGVIGVRLMPKEQRGRLVKDIVRDLRKLTTGRYAGAEMRYSTEDPLESMLFTEGKPLVMEIYGHDLDTGMNIANEIAVELANIKGVVDVEISRKIGKPELHIKVDRDRASHLGLSVSDIGNTIQTFFSGKEATKYREKGKEYEIFVRLREEDRGDIKAIRDSFITSSTTGKQVRLANVAYIEEELGPVRIERKNQQRVINASANLSGRDLGSVSKEVKEKISRLGIPKDFFISFGGEREEQVKAFGLLRIALLVGILLVYMVMAAQFESFRDPFIILFSIPFGMIGIAWTHLIFRLEFNMDSFIGLIMIVGIVVNNAIVLISYMNILRARGQSVREAITEGGRSRLRPVLMTTLTTVIGLVPLALSRGQGSEEWVTLGLTVIGGLMVSTLITLIFVPTLYSIFEDRAVRKYIEGGIQSIKKNRVK